MLSYHSKTFLASKSWRNLYPLFFPMSITPILWGVVLCIVFIFPLLPKTSWFTSGTNPHIPTPNFNLFRASRNSRKSKFFEFFKAAETSFRAYRNSRKSPPLSWYYHPVIILLLAFYRLGVHVVLVDFIRLKK